MPGPKSQVSHHGASGKCVRLCRCVRSLHGQLHTPSHVVVCPAGLLLPSVDVQSLPSPVRDATPVFLCTTLAFVPPAIGSACPQMVKNRPSIQLMTHEVRELSGKCVWLGSSMPMLPQGSHLTLVQQVLRRRCELLQLSCEP